MPYSTCMADLNIEREWVKRSVSPPGRECWLPDKPSKTWSQRVRPAMVGGGMRLCYLKRKYARWPSYVWPPAWGEPYGLRYTPARPPRGVARDRQLDVALVQAVMDHLAPRQMFSAGPCACVAAGLRYGW